jgi:hypothetical protein
MKAISASNMFGVHLLPVGLATGVAAEANDMLTSREASTLALEGRCAEAKLLVGA